jgi:hypothetical protein
MINYALSEYEATHPKSFEKSRDQFHQDGLGGAFGRQQYRDSLRAHIVAIQSHVAQIQKVLKDNPKDEVAKKALEDSMRMANQSHRSLESTYRHHDGYVPGQGVGAATSTNQAVMFVTRYGFERFVRFTDGSLRRRSVADSKPTLAEELVAKMS